MINSHFKIFILFIYLLIYTTIIKCQSTTTDEISATNNIIKTDFPITTIVGTTKMPFVVGAFQGTSSTSTCTPSYCTLIGDKLAKNNVKVTHASAWDICIGMIATTPEGCKVSTYNTVTRVYQQKNFNNQTCTNVAIDDKYIYVTTTQNYLEIFTHDNECGAIQYTDKRKPFAKGTDVKVLFANPRTKPDRSVFLFQESSKVLTQFEFNEAMTSMEVASTTNLADACHVTQFGIDGKVSASYHNGFRLFNIYDDKSQEFQVDDQGTTDFCGPFAQYGLDVYALPQVGASYFKRIVPGIQAIINKPCYNMTNGRVQLTGSIERFSFLWMDNKSNLTSRDHLAPGVYRIRVTAKAINVSNDIIINIYPPENPAYADIAGACLGESLGRVNFSSPRDPTLEYSFVLKDGNITKTSKDGYFNFLKSKAYSFYVNTTDEYGFTCRYSVNTTVQEGKLPNITYIVDSGSCFNKSDGSITILNYNRQFIYDLIPYGRFANGTYVNLIGGSYVLKVRDNSTNYKCPAFFNIEVPQPPPFRYPKFNVSYPRCHGLNGTINIEYIKGLEYMLRHPSGRVFEPYINANGTNRYKNLPIGNYSLDCMVLSRDGQICKKSTTYINIKEPELIQLSRTKLSSQCSKDGKENLIVYAHGGVPINGSSYYFVGKYSNATGPYLNVSYWVDGVYSLNITDREGCVSIYTNFTIDRPAGCVIYYDGNGRIVHRLPPLLTVGPIHITHSTAIALGVALGVGIPLIAAAVVAGIYLYRNRFRLLSRAPKQSKVPSNSIPVFLGGKIKNIDNF